MESYLLSLDLPILYIDFVSHKDYRNIFTYSDQISVPFSNVLVSDSGAYIKHEDASVSANAKFYLKWNLLVAISEASKDFLASSIPNIEQNWSVISVKSERSNLHTLGRDVALLEFSCDVTLNESGFANSTITY